MQQQQQLHPNLNENFFTIMTHTRAAMLLSVTARSVAQQRYYTAIRSYTQYKGYFLHPHGARVDVSLSKNPAKISVGSLPAASVSRDAVEVSPANFSENPEFLKRLFVFLKKRIYEDYSYQLECAEYAGSFMPIYDFRRVPEYGRRSDVEDVYGWVRVDERGSMVGDSFEANEFYRVVSGVGLPEFSEFMKENVEEYL